MELNSGAAGGSKRPGRKGIIVIIMFIYVLKVLVNVIKKGFSKRYKNLLFEKYKHTQEYNYKNLYESLLSVS